MIQIYLQSTLHMGKQKIQNMNNYIPALMFCLRWPFSHTYIRLCDIIASGLLLVFSPPIVSSFKFRIYT